MHYTDPRATEGQLAAHLKPTYAELETALADARAQLAAMAEDMQPLEARVEAAEARAEEAEWDLALAKRLHEDRLAWWQADNARLERTARELSKW